MCQQTIAKHYLHIQKKQSNMGIQLELSFSLPVEWSPRFTGTFSPVSSANSWEKHLALWLPGCFDRAHQPLSYSGSPPFLTGQEAYNQLVCAWQLRAAAHSLICGGRWEAEWLNNSEPKQWAERSYNWAAGVTEYQWGIVRVSHYGKSFW